MIKVIFLLLLISVLVAPAKAAQLGRITGEVNFREGPNRLTARIGRVPAGAEVEVIKRDPNGWYFVVHGGQRGFVHPNYVVVETASKAKKRLGVILMAFGAVLVTLYFVPILSRLALLLILSLSAVLLLDVGFSLGVLYSLFSVSLALLILLLILKRKEKSLTISAEDRAEVTRKAA